MALKDFMVKQNATMMGHQTIGGYLGGPATFVIDPAAIGDNTGTVQIKGNLQVDGTNTTINSATLTVDDKNIVVASGAGNAAAADGAGLTIDGASATLTYTASNDRFAFNKELTVARVHGNVTGDVTGTVSDISNHSTTNLSEGTNLYFTNARADARIAASDTDALSEGSTNLYYTDARAQAISINNVVEDTTPQLGGTLDANGNTIDMGTNVLTDTNLGQFATAYGWGNHGSAGYLTAISLNTLSAGVLDTQNDSIAFIDANDSNNSKKETVADFLTAIAGTGISVSSGQLTASVTETDTLDSVTTRGATTTNDISVNKVTSTVSTGTAPLVVASTTKVANLNADKLDDKELTDIIAEATALAIALGQKMAQVFKNYTQASIGTTPTTVYTVPGATTSIVIGLNLANRTTNTITASAQLGSVYIIKDAPIPGGGALSVLEGKIIAEAADTIVVTSNTASSTDAIVSVLEQT